MESVKTVTCENFGAPAQHAYRLINGAIVHPACREAYVEKRKHSHDRPTIEAVLYPGYQMPSGRFQLCAHCEAPIWDAPKRTAA